MLLILQMIVVLTIQMPFLPGQTPVQFNTIDDLVPITAHGELHATETVPGRFFLCDEPESAFLSADGSGQTSTSILERLRELLRITHRKLRHIHRGSSIAMDVTTDREGRFLNSAIDQSDGSPFGLAFCPIEGSFTRTDPRISNQFAIDPISPRPDQSLGRHSKPMAGQWSKPSCRFRKLGKEPFPVCWWQRG